MEEMAREVLRLALEVQQEFENLRQRAAHSNDPARSTGSAASPDSVAEVLERVEQKLVAVHEHTSELVKRVPQDLNQALLELRQALIFRLEEAASANGPTDSNDSGNSGHSAPSPLAAAKLLTPQERRVFQLCFQSGFLSYGEIAQHLDVTPAAAKNLVNRIFQSDRKRPLFAKEYSHGSARVGIRPDLEKRILRGKAGGEGKRMKTAVSAGD